MEFVQCVWREPVRRLQQVVDRSGNRRAALCDRCEEGESGVIAQPSTKPFSEQIHLCVAVGQGAGGGGGGRTVSKTRAVGPTRRGRFRIRTYTESGKMRDCGPGIHWGSESSLSQPLSAHSRPDCSFELFRRGGIQPAHLPVHTAKVAKSSH